tara:strand:- start:52 stop:216 length:165 start_codon:yes stop_codon:yes gene_type:complete
MTTKNKKPSYKNPGNWARGNYNQENDKLLKELRQFNTDAQAGWNKMRAILKKNK